MRLFVAVPLPPKARAAAAAACHPLVDLLPPARWVPQEQWHVTLWFLGKETRSAVDPLVSTLRRCVGGVTPFLTELGGGGTYPPGRRARVAWIGLVDSRGWSALDAAMRVAATALGRPFGERPVAPHVTVARPRPPWPRQAVATWRRSLPATLGAGFAVTAAVLCHSELGPGGARHHELAVLPLGGSP